jgi:hypothetical protein
VRLHPQKADEEVTVSDQMPSPRPGRAPVAAALAVASSGLLAASLALERARVYLVAAALVCSAVALVSAWRSRRGRSGRRTTQVLAVAVALSLAATGLAGTHWTTTSTTFESAAGTTDIVQGAVQAVPVSEPRTEFLDADELTTERRLKVVADTAAAVQPVSSTATRDRIALAREIGYTPASGLTLDWDSALAQDVGAAETVTVPLIGTDLPQVTKVSFLATSEGMTIVEMASAMLPDGGAGMKIWQNGVLIRDVVVTDSEAAGSADGLNVTPAGWSFNKFKQCLNNAGVVSATISLVAAACSVACAITAGTACFACLAAILGGNSGMMGTCVAWAST